MYGIRRTARFKKDVKRLQRRGSDLAAIKEAIRRLSEGEKLPAGLRDHALKGPLRDCRECHAGPDLLLLYRIDEDELQLIRAGTHSDLFG